MRPANEERNASRCICPAGCPTYNECTRSTGQRLFCAVGSTECAMTANGCICGSCPVWEEYGLGSYYFCMEGAAAE